jgi:predicted ATP-dependent endonuclease of OLD family
LNDIIEQKLDRAVRDYADFLNLTSQTLDISNIQFVRQGYPAVIGIDESDEERNKYHQLRFEEQGLKSPLVFRSLSYGSQQLLHLLMLTHDAKGGQVICIEEPENHLHSYVQKKLFNRIVEKSKEEDVQFFITTHSPIFTALEKDAIVTYLVTRADAVSKITPIENDSELRLIKQHLGIENSDIYLSPYVIFVEGMSEKIALEMIGPVMGYTQMGKEVRIINFEGKDRFPRLTEFLKYIDYFDTKAIVLADGHDDIKNHIENLKRQRNLSFIDKTRPEGKEFEDLFDTKAIIMAMNNLSRDRFRFDMNENELETKRKGNNVARILEDYMQETNGIELDKTLLAKELSLIIIKEIRESKPGRSKSTIEREINEIMNVVDSEDKNLSGVLRKMQQ